MSIAPLTFTGVSTFSTDFQTILNRQVQIAQIPVKALQNQDSTVLSKQALLASLNETVAGLGASLASLGRTAANRALGASSSNTDVVTVANGGATSAATYTINSVTSVASAASERTLASVATANSTAVSSTGDVKLVAGGHEYSFSLTDNSLVGLRDKINSLGAGVTASILTTSPTDNYLSITATATGATTLQLFDDPLGANTNLLTATNQGSNAEFQLNGIDISQSSNVVNSVVPGLTFNIVGESADPVTLTLATDRGQLSSALQSFVTQYNAVRSKLSAEQGPGAGLLTGDPAIGALSAALRRVAGYRTDSGSVQGLSDLGIVFSKTGEASFDATVFGGLSDTGIADAFAFVGSASSGLGGFSERLDEFSNTVTGFIQSEQASLTRVDTDLQKRIATLDERNQLAQKSLAAKLQQADALVAGLQSEQTVIDATIKALEAALLGTNK